MAAEEPGVPIPRLAERLTMRLWRLAFPLALLATAGHGTAVAANDMSYVAGPAVVIDASHLEVAGQRLKLYGIDAPDADETCKSAKDEDYPCGVEARAALQALVKTTPQVECLPRGPNQMNEMMATCSAGKTDLAKALVTAGWAIADRPRTLYYEDDELAARTAKRGLWQGRFIAPQAWRSGTRKLPPKNESPLGVL